MINIIIKKLNESKRVGNLNKISQKDSLNMTCLFI